MKKFSELQEYKDEVGFFCKEPTKKNAKRMLDVIEGLGIAYQKKRLEITTEQLKKIKKFKDALIALINDPLAK